MCQRGTKRSGTGFRRYHTFARIFGHTHRSLAYAVARQGHPALAVAPAAAAPAAQPRGDGTSDPYEPRLFDRVDDAIKAVARGEFVLVLDDEDRENEGDLILAAEKVTPAAIAFMVEHTSGVVCVALPAGECARLDLPLMVPSRENEEAMSTAFTVTVDARRGVSTGISASDRAETIRLLAGAQTQPGDLRRPGHVFPLIARDGGVLTRPGHTEAAADLARLAGCRPAGVLAEVVDKETGEMARTPLVLKMAKAWGLCCITIDALVRHRLECEPQPAEGLRSRGSKCADGNGSAGGP